MTADSVPDVEGVSVGVREDEDAFGVTSGTKDVAHGEGGEAASGAVDEHAGAALAADEVVRSKAVVRGEHSVSGNAQQLSHDARRRKAGLVLDGAATDGLSNLRVDLAMERNIGRLVQGDRGYEEVAAAQEKWSPGLALFILRRKA